MRELSAVVELQPLSCRHSSDGDGTNCSLLLQHSRPSAAANVVATLHSRAGTGRGNALLIVSTYPTHNGAGGDGAAIHPAFVVLALAAAVSQAKWLGKDVIFAFVPMRNDASDAAARIDAALGVHEFVKGYMWRPPLEHVDCDGAGDRTNCHAANWVPPLSAVHAGAIHAAIVLAFPTVSSISNHGDPGSNNNHDTSVLERRGGGRPRLSDHRPAVELHTQGPWGRVPELDLFSTLHLSFTTVGIDVRVGTEVGGSRAPTILRFIRRTIARIKRSAAGSGGERLLSMYDAALPALISLGSAISSVLNGDGGGGDRRVRDAILASRPVPAAVRAWIEAMHGIIRFSASLISPPLSAHGVLLGERINAISISAASAALAPQPDAAALGGALEAAIRSLSGLEERLHASTPWYLLFSPPSGMNGDRHAQYFVGLHEYAGAFALMMAPPIASFTLTTHDSHAGTLAAVASAWAVMAALVTALIGLRWTWANTDSNSVTVPFYDVVFASSHWLHRHPQLLAALGLGGGRSFTPMVHLALLGVGALATLCAITFSRRWMMTVRDNGDSCSAATVALPDTHSNVTAADIAPSSSASTTPHSLLQGGVPSLNGGVPSLNGAQPSSSRAPAADALPAVASNTSINSPAPPLSHIATCSLLAASSTSSTASSIATGPLLAAWVWFGSAQFCLLYLLYPLAAIGGFTMLPMLCCATAIVDCGDGEKAVHSAYRRIARGTCGAMCVLWAAAVCFCAGWALQDVLTGASNFTSAGTDGFEERGGGSLNGPMLNLWALGVLLPVCSLTSGALIQ